jgi:glycosyltransferase involved in cell wall biosynthesis
VKVLIYSSSFAPQIGGVETYVMLLAQGLAQDLTWSRPSQLPSQLTSQAIQVVLVTQSPRGAFDESALAFAVVRQPGFLRLASLIWRSDVIHLAGPVLTPLFLAVLLRKPVVVEHHGYQASCPNGLLLYEPTKSPCPGHYMQHHYRECVRCNAVEAGWFNSLRWLVLTAPRRWLCARANANVGVTNHVIGRVQLPRSRVIYHGVPVHPAKINVSAQTNSPYTLSVAYVGRLVKEKGVATLIRAALHVQKQGYPISLKIIGDGPQRQALEAMAGETSGGPYNIHFTGLLLGDALDDALHDVTVVVIPTIMEETAGMAVIEQMMRGGPVVVSDTGGLAEVAGDGGLKFPPGDAAALAGCLRRLVDEPDLLAELAARAKKRATTFFTQSRMVEDHLRIFLELAPRS